VRPLHFSAYSLGMSVFFFIELRVHIWSRVQLEKLKIAQLVEKFSVFRGMQSFMAMFQKTQTFKPVPI